MKCIEVRAVRGLSPRSSVARSVEVLRISTGLIHYCTFGLEAANDVQNVRVHTARGKDNRRIYQK